MAVASIVACGRTQASPASGPDHAPAAAWGAPSTGASSAPAPGRSPIASGDGSSPAEVPWPLLVGNERWNAAWRALEALADADKSRPEIRYVRARVALAREDPSTAIPLLDGLESALPLLAEDIGRWRASAKLAVGPFEEAGDWLAARPAPAAQLEAARAFEKAKDAKQARAAVDRVLSSSKRTRAQEAEARALRVRIAESPSDVERGDTRWLATYGADIGPADALASVARLDPKHPLTAQEWMTRSRTLAEAGRTDEALRTIDLAAGAAGADKVGEIERMRARGTILFRARGHWSEAARIAGGMRRGRGYARRGRRIPRRARAFPRRPRRRGYSWIRRRSAPLSEIDLGGRRSLFRSVSAYAARGVARVRERVRRVSALAPER